MPASGNDTIFYNALYPYYRSLPFFIPPEEVKQREILEKNWKVFRDEFLEYHKKGLTDKDSMRTGRGYYQEGLKTITLLTNMYKYHKRCEHFPKTMAILESIPELCLVTINVLKEGMNIKPHYGETSATYRCHIGLIVPDGLPKCGIRVGNEERAWEEGKMLAFVDANRHKVWNHSSGIRVVLIVDFIRPGIKKSKWEISGRGLASALVTGLIVRWNFLKKTPLFIAKFINFSLGYSIISVIWLQRKLKFELPFVSRN